MSEPIYSFTSEVLGDPGAQIMEIALTKSDRGSYVALRRCAFDEDKWKIIYGGACLTRSGQWLGEMLPSSRSDEFLEMTRFTLNQALNIWKEYYPEKWPGNQIGTF